MLEKGRLLRDKISLEDDEGDASGSRKEVKGVTGGGRDRDVASSSSSSSSSEEEEDFMSDAFLAGVESESSKPEKKKEETYTERRRREVGQARERGITLNRVDREHQARREGLSRSLFGEFDTAGRQEDEGEDISVGNKKRKTDGEQSKGASSSSTSSNKALKMMMAMGYEHGRSLGKRDELEEEDEDEEDTDAEEEGDHGKDPVRPRQGYSSKLVEPLPLDERWLGLRVRAGIGQVSTRSAQASLSRDISAASTKEAERQNRRSTAAEDSFRSRSSAEHSIRHWERLLVNARRTCEDLDTEQGVKYSPLWINPESLSKQASELPEHVAQLIEYALAGLDEDASSSSSSPQPDEEARARAQETKQFCFLPAKVRLDITISHLRRAHNYCLYCGQRYNTAEQLSNECPGEDEDDH